MKKLMLSLLIAAPAFGAAKPLITKNSGGGFMMPEYAGYERCEVFQNKVVITHLFGMQSATALKLVEERKIQLNGDLKLVIEKAASEQVESRPNGLCDGPSTSISADIGGESDLLLFVTGGCGSPRQERQGPLSHKLRSIVNQFCEKTYDFGTEQP